MTEIKLPFFSRGEISPRLYGRVDTAAYQSGLKTARNVIVGVGGSVMNRPGTIFITPVKFYDKYTRLIPFAFSSVDTCMLEFGDFYMRVIREDFPQLSLNSHMITSISQGTTTTIGVTAHGYSNDQEIVIDEVGGMVQLNKGRFVVADATTNSFALKSKISGDFVDSTSFTAYTSGGVVDSIYEIVTPYQAEDLATLKYAQSADVLTLTHPSYPVMELKRFALNNWEVDPAQFVSLASIPDDITGNVNNPGTDVITYTVTAVNRTTNTESLPGLAAFKYTIAAATNANPIHMTLTVPHGLQDDDEVFIRDVSGMTEINDRRFVLTNCGIDDFDLRDEDGSAYGVFTSALANSLCPTFIRLPLSDGVKTNNTISWDAVTDASLYNVYKDRDGVFGFIGETTKTSFVDDNILATITDTPPTERNPFRVEGDWPGAVGFYQQRRVFGGSNNNPATWYASRPGDFNNFGTSFPTQDDDSITATLVSGEINQIKNFASAATMGVFTTGQEWSVSSGGSVAFSPLTAKVDPETNYGTSEHRPYILGATTVFVQQDNRTVRSFGFQFETDGFKSNELSLFSDHLFDTYEIRDWGHARTPYSAMVLTRTDGDAAMFVFNEEQNVMGWTRWDTQGDFETVGVVKVCLELETPEPDDGIYFVVKRNINGKSVKFIERVHKRRFIDVRDAFFVDCGRTYDEPYRISNVETADNFSSEPFGTVIFTAVNHPYENDMVVDISDIEWEPNVDASGNEIQPAQFNDTQYIVHKIDADRFSLKTLGIGTSVILDTDFTTFNSYIKGGVVREAIRDIYNLDHLEGKTVSVLANGYPLRNMTVANGAITLPGLASRVHVGLPYVSDVETLDIEPNMGSQSIQGRMKKIHKVVARFDKSRELLVGPDPFNLIPMKRAPFTTVSAQLFTGDRDIILLPTWNSNGRVFFRQLDPMPFNLLAVFPSMEIN